MTELVIGGNGSGKSAYAEKEVLAAGCGRVYYLATMRVLDEEMERKVARHRRMRAGRGWLTIEQPVDIGQAANVIQIVPEDTVVQNIVAGIRRLMACTDCLVLVSNSVFSDGITYDEGTEAYIRALGRINQEISGMADRVTEVVAGIPVGLK